MGSRIAGVSSLLLAALFSGENQNYSHRNFSSAETPMPISKDISNSLVKQAPGKQLTANLPVPGRIHSEPSLAWTFRNIKGFHAREQYLTNTLELVNPHLLQESAALGNATALSEFNRKHNMNFQCLSIRDKPCEFVFIDNNYFLKSGIGKTNIPRRISISLEEAQVTQSKQDVINLLENKLSQHDELYDTENVMWNVPFRFDFPKNKGACMIALMLNPDYGMETDVAYFLNVYVREFGMSPYALPVGTTHVNDMQAVLKDTGYENLSDLVVPATKDSILQNLENSLRKAVDDGKEFFVFHYLTHGSADGKICVEDGRFDPREISEIISRSHKGEPLCSKLDIYIQAGACYSGKQLESMVDFFKWGRNKDIPVKNLYVISESNHTTAVFSSSWEKTSLISDNLLVHDWTGPQAYYDSWVKEYANYLKTKGLKVRPEVLSMLWRLRFADLMTWYDEAQNMKGFHYSNDPKTKKVTGQHFTEARPVIYESYA